MATKAAESHTKVSGESSASQAPVVTYCDDI